MFTLKVKEKTGPTQTDNEGAARSTICPDEAAQLGKSLMRLLVYSSTDSIVRVLEELERSQGDLVRDCGFVVRETNTVTEMSCQSYAGFLSKIGRQIIFKKLDRELVLHSLAEAFQHISEALRVCRRARTQTEELLQSAKRMKLLGQLSSALGDQLQD